MFLAMLEQEDVAVGIGDGEGVSVFDCGYGFFVEDTGGFAQVFRFKGETSFGAKRSGRYDLDLFTGFSGKMHVHLVAGDGFEVELVDVVVAGEGSVVHGKGDGDQLCRNAVGAEVFALVVGMKRARHVLGVLDVLRTGWLGWAGHGEEQVASTGFADGSGGQAATDVVVVDGVEIVAFKAEVEEADVGGLVGGGVEFDELLVVDLDEGFVGDAVFLEIEGLLEAEFFVEGDGGGEIVDTKSDVGDSVEGGWWGAVGLGVGGGSEEGGEESDEESACAELTGARGLFEVHSLFL
jgi:hypothetical protein